MIHQIETPITINPQIRSFIMKARILFVIDGCEMCAKYKEFIESINLEVLVNKRIRVIDATNFNSFGILDHHIIKLFDPLMKGSYPFLFFDGNLLSGANSREECEAFIRASLHNDFTIPRKNKYLFNKTCRYIDKGIFNKKTLICNNG